MTTPPLKGQAFLKLWREGDWNVIAEDFPTCDLRRVMPPGTSPPRYIELADDCFRDPATGVEYTPTLNPDNPAPHSSCAQLVKDCKLAGGGWRLADDPHQLIALVDYGWSQPAVHPQVSRRINRGWHWTQKTAPEEARAPFSNVAWSVDFSYGDVFRILRDSHGFAIGVRRRVPA